ncbi:MAG: ROK family glucokinase [Clostridia bacterium]|nr:ROK family glucokinase [Clostridia bacterium]
MYNLGIDLGGMSVKVGVVDENNAIIGKAAVPTNSPGQPPRPADDIMDDIATACHLAVENAGVSFDDVANIGLGCPGSVNSETGMLEFSGNLGMQNYPVSAKLEERLSRKVFVENDANVAAFGESIAGAAKGARNAVCVTLGTGVGGGIIIDGKIYSGSNYAGGELGHMVIVANGRPCTCGRNGCWEAYASATALIHQTQVKMLDCPNSEMWKIADGDLRNVNGRTAFDAYRAGDKAGAEVVDTYISYIACGLTNVINIFQPDIICIGGGISKEGDTLTAPLMSYVNAERFGKNLAKQTEIVVAQLGNDAGIIGAANLFLMHE